MLRLESRGRKTGVLHGDNRVEPPRIYVFLTVHSLVAESTGGNLPLKIFRLMMLNHVVTRVQWCSVSIANRIRLGR